MAENATTLRGISELRGFFRTNETPVYFISPIAFNLLGIDRWVRRFYYVNYFDSFDGGHPRVFVPAKTPHAQFGSIEDVCNYLLEHQGVHEFVEAHRQRTAGGRTGQAVLVFFDADSERRVSRWGSTSRYPQQLRHRLDSKIITTRLGEEAGVPSVPNVLGRATSYADLSTWRRPPGWARTSSSRPPTETPARRRSSFAASATGTPTPARWPTRRSR